MQFSGALHLSDRHSPHTPKDGVIGQVQFPVVHGAERWDIFVASMPL